MRPPTPGSTLTSQVVCGYRNGGSTGSSTYSDSRHHDRYHGTVSGRASKVNTYSNHTTPSYAIHTALICLIMAVLALDRHCATPNMYDVGSELPSSQTVPDIWLTITICFGPAIGSRPKRRRLHPSTFWGPMLATLVKRTDRRQSHRLAARQSVKVASKGSKI